MTNSEDIGFLAGLLDFYSDKSNTHGSFVVAGVFGMYALLAFYNELPFWGFLISYVALLILGIYAFLNFSYYGACAHQTAMKLKSFNESCDITSEDLANMGKLTQRFRSFRTWIIGWKQYGILVSLWFCAVIMPLIFAIWG